ncbi:MAG: alcohol dehydrogenase catalytic domain-containing protein, partial [Candidatus Limnocylindria bacterium]
VEAAGICGSDIEGYLGRMSNRRPPLVMGHEFAGRVTAVGEGVTASLVGRRAAVNPLITCGRCGPCGEGLRNVCLRRGLVGVDRAGGFADDVAVPASALIAISEDCDARLAALAEPFANGVHAIRLGSAARLPKTALVLGAGTIGVLAMQAARIARIQHVAVSEPDAARREQALRLGADSAYADAADALAAARELPQGGFELVVDAAGVEGSRRLAVEALRPAGVAVMLGLHSDATAVPFHRVVRQQLTIQGSYAYTDEDFAHAVRLLEEGRVDLGTLAAVRPLSDGPAMFAEVANAPPERIKLFVGPAA